MRMLLFRVILYLTILITITQAGWFRVRFKKRSNCFGQKSCESCTSKKSWSGASCRWCPEDGKCHAHMAFLTNPCGRTKSIVSKARCSSIVQTTYDRNVAYKMVFLSALAYADEVVNYITKESQINTFQLRKQVTVPCQGNAKCSGFVAVSHTEKSITVAFRGSQHSSHVLYQGLFALLTPKVAFQAGGKVLAYLNRVFHLIWEDLKSEVYGQITKYPSYQIWVTGHSLGGALASMASTVIAYEETTTRKRLMLYTFGQPRAGDYKYALTHDRLVPVSFRITHYRDPAVHLPTCRKRFGVGPCLTSGGGSYHHGKEIYYGQSAMTKYSSYKICNGLPRNEDAKCSNNILTLLPCLTSYKTCLDDHYYYFGIKVGDWWLGL